MKQWPTLASAGWLLASIGVSLLLVAFWYFVAHAKLVSPVFLPGPERVWDALVYGMTEGDLLWKTVRTIERMFYGWLIASLIGILLGSLIGISETARAYFEPTLEFLRPLPASAMMPVAIVLLGLSELDGPRRDCIRRTLANAARHRIRLRSGGAPALRGQPGARNVTAVRHLENSITQRDAGHSFGSAHRAYDIADPCGRWRNAGEPAWTWTSNFARGAVVSVGRSLCRRGSPGPDWLRKRCAALYG